MQETAAYVKLFTVVYMFDSKSISNETWYSKNSPLVCESISSQRSNRKIVMKGKNIEKYRQNMNN